MNIVEMHQAVMQGVDKVHAQAADTLLSAEIDIELNKAIQKFVTTRFQQNNKYRTGFEESQKRRDDLRRLVVEKELTCAFKEVVNDYDAPYPVFVDYTELPKEYMYFINLQATIWASNRCEPIAYLVDMQEDFYYFAIPMNAMVGNNVDGNSESWVTRLSVASHDPSDSDALIGYDASLGQNVAITWMTWWRWGYSWNQTDTAYSSLNDATVFPSGFSQVLGDILSYARGGLFGNNYTGLNPSPGSYWDPIGPDYENLGNVNMPGHIIVPWNDMMGEQADFNADGILENVYSADLSNGHLSYMVAWMGSGIVYQTPLRVKHEFLQSKRFPSTYNSLEDSWTNVGLIRETNPVKLVQFDDIYSMTQDPFNKTKPSSPLATMRENYIDIYTDDTFIVDKVKLTYIKEPTIVESPNTDCDLPIHTHEEIVQMAVASILESFNDPRYQTHQIEVGKIE